MTPRPWWGAAARTQKSPVLTGLRLMAEREGLLAAPRLAPSGPPSLPSGVRLVVRPGVNRFAGSKLGRAWRPAGGRHGWRPTTPLRVQTPPWAYRSIQKSPVLMGLRLMAEREGLLAALRLALRAIGTQRRCSPSLRSVVKPSSRVQIPPWFYLPETRKPRVNGASLYGGEGGIRTLGTGLPYTHFPGVLLRPLGHLSRFRITFHC